jgi:hypothetical protein
MIYDLVFKAELLRFNVAVDNARNNPAKYELSKKQKRTVTQNRYLHALLKLLAVEMGLTLAETKQELKGACHFMMYVKNESRYLKSTADLDSNEMGRFIDWLREWSPQNLGLELMDAEEYRGRADEVDQELRKFDKYL